MSDLLPRLQDAKVEFSGIVTAIRVFIEKFVGIFASEIAACEDEAAFYKLLAEIGDELYVGNIVTEAIDYEVFKFILTKGVDPILDKILGADWFTVLKAQAISLKQAAETND